MKVKGVNGVKKIFTKVAGRKLLQLKKYSPEILISFGVAGVVTSTVLACRATLKVHDILDEANDDLNDIERVFEGEQGKEESRYSEQDYKRDLSVVYIQTGVKFVKLYGPALVVGVSSIGCLLGAHKIMKNRNIALVAAYKVMEKGFLDYRNRVIKELGEEKDKEFKYGLTEKTLQEPVETSTGRDVQINRKVKVADPNGLSPYARFFDASCTQWSKTPEYNIIYVKGQQAWANDMLHARGHIFLNEVYDVLGIPRTQAGNVVGWALTSDNGDNFVDFGIFEARNADFVNGYEYSALLDFNVDGVIFDLI